VARGKQITDSIPKLKKMKKGEQGQKSKKEGGGGNKAWGKNIIWGGFKTTRMTRGCGDQNENSRKKKKKSGRKAIFNDAAEVLAKNGGVLGQFSERGKERQKKPKNGEGVRRDHSTASVKVQYQKHV